MSHLVLPFHLGPCLGLPKGPLSSDLPPKVLHAYLTSSIRATYSAQLILLCFVSLKCFAKYVIKSHPVSATTRLFFYPRLPPITTLPL